MSRTKNREKYFRGRFQTAAKTRKGNLKFQVPFGVISYLVGMKGFEPSTP